ncbi:MAG: PTS fructose transporter subunit IIB [Anaerolineaceae bacterium]|nr:PTS fructose transporter subunit IIB [Anaerolineaceae bacterium]
MKIVCVSACAAGIAHTYMAAEAIKKAARQAGDEVRIEIQGAMGIENRLTQEEINEADLVIFAVNIDVRDKNRFEEKNPIVIDPGKFVADGAKALANAKELAGL